MTTTPTVGGIPKYGSWGKRPALIPGMTTFHRGVDIAAPVGTPVVAPEAGVVTTSTYNVIRGHYVVVDHGGGWSTSSQHLSKRLVVVGEHVAERQLVGLSGKTGNVTGPHDHTEVRWQGTPIDPAPWYAARGVTLGVAVKVLAEHVTEEDDMAHLWKYTSATPPVFIVVDDLTMTYRVIPSGSLQEKAIKNDIDAGVRRFDVIADPGWGETFGSGQYRRIDTPDPAPSAAGGIDPAALKAAVRAALDGATLHLT